MNLVQFNKPRARWSVHYHEQEGWVASWVASIRWQWHGSGYTSIGEHADLECAVRHAWRPLIEQGWLRHAPKHWVPDSLKPVWQMAQINRYGEAP